MIGRQRERAWLAEALADPGAAVQLVGPPGIGKSTLARAASAGRRAAWLSLEPVDPDAVLGALAAVFGVPADLGAVIVALQDVEILVLDGAEGVVGTIGPVLERLRDALPALRVLVTTQHRLPGVPLLWEVGPLGHAAGVELFVDRARALSQAFDLAEEGAAVEELVRRLDGWPLAVELAASRVRLYSCAELLEAGPLAVLADPSRRGRHASLDGVLAASWALLRPEDQRALAAVALFRGSFDRAGFVEVSGAGVDTLERLLDVSLARGTSEGGRRSFHLLNPVRVFALDRLDDPAARSRYAAAVTGRAARAVARESTSEAASARAELVALASDLQSLLPAGDADAARAALALAALARARGPVGQAAVWLGAVPRDGLDRELARELDLSEADLLLRGPDGEKAGPLLDRWPDTPRVVRLRGLMHVNAHRIPEGIAVLERAEAMARAEGDLEEAIHAGFTQGIGHVRRDEVHEGHALFRRCLDAIGPLDRPDLEGALLKFMALTERELGVDHGPRVARLQRAADLHRRTDARRLEAMANSMLTLALDDAGDPRVDAQIEHTLTLAERAGVRPTVHQMEALRAMRALDRGDLPTVRAYAERARGSQGDAWTRAWGAALEGLAEHVGGGPDAEVRLTDAVRRFTELGLHGDAWLYQVYLNAILGVEPPALAHALPPGGTKRLVFEVASLAAAGASISSALQAACATRIEARLALLLVQQGPGVRVASDGGWFQTRDGARTDLSRKRVLRRVLATLADGEPRTWEALLAEVWPGERMTADSGRARVHVAVSELRRMGLRDALVTDQESDGAAYRLRAQRVDP